MEYRKLMTNEKGVAGLNVLLSLISMIFMIGIIVMVFVIAGAKLRDSSQLIVLETATDTVQSDFLLNSTIGAVMTNCAGQIGGAITSVSSVVNESITLTTANYTTSGCYIYATATSEYNNHIVDNVTYSYTHGGEALRVINKTTNAIGDTPDWFPTFIVLGSLVVLILLVVVIINSIKSSGITEGA